MKMTNCGVPVDQHADDCPFCGDTCADCGKKAEVGDTFGQVHGKWYCHANDCYAVAMEGWAEYEAELDGPDPHGYRDPSPEQLAGEQFQDRYDMYRNEY